MDERVNSSIEPLLAFLSIDGGLSGFLHWKTMVRHWHTPVQVRVNRQSHYAEEKEFIFPSTRQVNPTVVFPVIPAVTDKAGDTPSENADGSGDGRDRQFLWVAMIRKRQAHNATRAELHGLIALAMTGRFLWPPRGVITGRRGRKGESGVFRLSRRGK
jgi:hypothetical protein